MSVSTTNTVSNPVLNLNSENESPPDLIKVSEVKESEVKESKGDKPIDLNNTEMPEHDDSSVVEEPKKGIIGLDNLGNTCYLNSVIQTMSNLDDFRKFLFDGEFTEHLKGPLEESLFYQTFRIVKHMWESSEESLAPKSFKRKFVEQQKQFMGFEQQDSHEAMHFLIDHLHEEIARPIKLNISLPPELNEYFDFCDKYYQRFELDKDAKIDKDILKIFDTKLEETVDYFAMKYYNQLSTKYSSISEFFQSITCSLTKCPDCGHVSPKFDNNYMMELEIPELDDEDVKNSELFKKMFAEKVEELKEKTDNEELIAKFCINEIKQKYIHKLNDLLMNYQKSEKLDDSNLWNCEVCEKKVNGIKQTKIFKNPQYLIIHFKRFKHITVNGNVNIMKIKNLIGYEKFLDIKPLMLKNTDNTKYELVGGINHMGEYQFGHFTNFARNNDKWYNFNDDKVNEINCTGIPLTQNAYMLIYKRCE
jgi:ubiquitin C-terminal hydrolase